MLPRRAAPEVLACNNDVARLDLTRKLRVGILHAVFLQHVRVRGAQVTGRDDGVGIHVVAEFICLALEDHLTTSCGAEILPITADAAATAGPQR